jgi:hypothetical protein
MPSNPMIVLAVTSGGLPRGGLLAHLLLLIFRYIDLTTRVAGLDAASPCTLAPRIYARIDVTNCGGRLCLRHAVQSNKECQGEKRKYKA